MMYCTYVFVIVKKIFFLIYKNSGDSPEHDGKIETIIAKLEIELHVYSQY